MVSSINDKRGANDPQRIHLINWLTQYMRSMLREGKSFNLLSKSSSVQADLIKVIGKFFNETYKLHSREIDEYLGNTQLITGFAEAIGNGENSPLQLQAEKVKKLCEKAIFPDLNNVVKRRLEAYAHGDFATAPSDTMRRGCDTPESCFLKSATPTAAMLNAVQTAIVEAVDYVERKNLYATLFRWLHQLGLFGQVVTYLNEYRLQNDSLLLSDTNDLLRQIINEDETPFIYERMGTAIRHYLIDEFQDTSRMQWANLQPLVLESLSTGNDNLIIGDEKQCIYRFRNSDPELLGHDVEQLARSRFDDDSVNIVGQKLSENVNWRSSVEVVKFNNTLFHYMAEALNVSDTYSGLVQKIDDKRLGIHGYVKIHFLPTIPQVAGASTEAADGGDGDDEAGIASRIMLERLTAEIDRQLTAGYQPKDIAVLVRTKDQGKTVISHLMEVMEASTHAAKAGEPQLGTWHHGVLPLMSADSMSITLSPAVRMIVDVLRLVTKPLMVVSTTGDTNDDGSPVMEMNPAYRRYRLLHRFELCRFDTVPALDGEGRPLLDEAGNAVRRRLTDSEALAAAIMATSAPVSETDNSLQAKLDAEVVALSKMDSPTLMAMTERIINQCLTDEVRRRDNVFITAFQDLVMDYTEHGDNNVNSFLDWWDRVGSDTNVAAPDGLNAINVLTIHKAKGLEYQCVHLPFCSNKMVKYHSSFLPSISWFDLRNKKSYFKGIKEELIPSYIPLPNMAGNTSVEVLREQAEKWETEQRIDALNVAYVAFTRAVSELCVYVDKMATIPAPKGKSQPTLLLSDYLMLAVEKMTEKNIAEGVDAEQAKWMLPLAAHLHTLDNEEVMFELGSTTTPAEKNVASTDTAATQPTDDIDYSHLLDEYVVDENSELCASMDFEYLTDFSYDDMRHRGIFLHSVLSNVHHISDLKRALNRQAYRYKLTDEQKADSYALLQDMLADERVRPWFENYQRVMNERALTAPTSMRRPDRVVWLNDGTIAVIDYKFGEHNSPKYREQVLDYISLLAQEGYPGAKGYLWFPLKSHNERIVEIK
jgi:ATP-dependent exoDNAse (exonuclease V) beta subunit